MAPRRVAIGPAALTEGEVRGYEVGTRMVLVVRKGGQYFAMDDWCNHAGCLLSGGWLEDEAIVCPCHGVGFALSSGVVTTKYRICDDQQTFPIEEEAGTLFVQLDDADFPKDA